MVTLKEIARACNVSPTTVSNILNGKPKVGDDTKQKVLETIDKMGYKPNYIAQGLRKQKTRTIGIIVEDIAQFTTPEIVEGIMSNGEEKGYRTVVKNMRLYARWRDTWYGDENSYHSILDPALQELESIRVDGIIYIAGHARIINCFPKDFPIPAVMTYAFSKNPDIPSVVIDDQKSAYEIVQYLISKGHTKIGVIGGRKNNIHTQQRLLGYQKALFENEILYNPNWIRYAEWEKEGALREARELFKTDVTAVFCMADRMAGGAYACLDEMGLRVGVDIAVAGFDNQNIADFFLPGLTTMALPLKEIGDTAANILFRKIQYGEESAEKQIWIPCKFIERQSVHQLKKED